MITKLTKQQEALKTQWFNTWLKIGSSTEPADKPLAEDVIKRFYEKLGKPSPLFMWVSSPRAAKKILEENGEKRNLDNFIIGQENAYWVCFYKFCRDVIKVRYEDSDAENLTLWENLTKSCSWWWPFEKIVLISDRPELISWNANRVLHNAKGPSVRFRDGWSIWSLNGVRMQKWHVENPPEKIDPQKILAEKNVDVRRELIRKVGVERMLSKLTHKVIDRMGDYELLSVDFSDGLKDCRYLKMKNPSIKCWHIEGVERAGDTVQEALDWRAQRIIEKGRQWKPETLT